MALNTLEGDNIIRQISYLKSRIARLEAYFQGTPVPSMKIGNISVDKLTTGVLGAIADLGGASTNAKVTIDGEENRIMIRDESAYDRILIGKQVGGF